MLAEIRPCSGGWAWFLLPAKGADAVGSGVLRQHHHQAVEDAQQLMLEGVGDIIDQHPDRPGAQQANPARKTA